MNTSHKDRFCFNGLPDQSLWPEFIFDLSELQYPEKLNAAVELLDKTVNAGHGDRQAIIDGEVVWTYTQLLHQANRIANLLVGDLGLQTGNRVLLRGRNSALLFACWYGVVKAGGVVVATMPMFRTKELHSIIDKAQIGYALCEGSLLDDLNEAATTLPCMKTVLGFGPGSVEAENLEHLMEEQDHTFDNADTLRDDVALLAFTSGTTGVPKACMHFHRDILAMADTFSRHITCPRGDDVYCATPPIAFTFGLGASLVFPARVEASVVLLASPSPENILSAVQEHMVTKLFTAPTAYRAMLDSVSDYDTSSLTHCISAGEPLPPATAESWLQKTGLRLIDGIGTTELIHVFLSAAGEDIRVGATGKPVPGYQACILDEAGVPQDSNVCGLLAVKGPTGCRYLNDERQKDYVQNGWNLTGDQYIMDDDGYFWFQGRADDMIISSGYNIAAVEVENAILLNEAVSECAVVGEPDSERGHIVKAFVILESGHASDQHMVKKIQGHVKQSIAAYKYPRSICFVTELPKTHTGKLQRYKLK